MRKLLVLLVAALLVAPATALAAESIEDLQKQIQEMTQELNELTKRVDKTERHSALDRINWYGDMRVKADTLHYKDVRLWDYSKYVAGTGMPELKKYNDNNDVLYTTRLRLGMKAKVARNVNFSGRLNMYKGWGDSTGVKVMDSFGAVSVDGTNSGNPTGDTIRVERAYFDWKDIGGSNFYLSAGRRPSTYGPPSQYRENEQRGGTPSGHLVHFNFDGITIGYKLGEHTGVEGQTVRFCYGQGYEADYGSGRLAQPTSDVKDVHLAGFNIDAINDGTNFLQLTAFKAFDVTDGFKGIVVMPNLFPFSSLYTPGVINHYDASTNIGDLTLVGAGFAREEMNGLNWFVSYGWTRTDPNGNAGPFGGLLTEVGGDDKQRNGYSVYAGVQVPAPLGKFGIEYNWGSKYWFNFTQAQDDIVGSKLAARGEVWEGYYIFDINPKMFLKLGALYYDYKYTGSGAQVGKPQKIDEVQMFTTHSYMPIVDKVWDGYASITVKF